MTTHDLVVIGGGMAGTMAVLAASTRGMDVAWIADAVGPTAQSGRWHAHLHRGRLYDPVREADLIAELHRSAAFWWSDPVRRFHTGIPTLAVGPDLGWATEFRRMLVGAHGERTHPRFLQRDAVAVRTDEAILDGPRFLTVACATAAQRSTHFPGRCVELTRVAGTWAARVGGDAGEDGVTVRARSAVVATGVAVDELIPPETRLDRRHGTRLARMLVLRGRLPRVAAIVPSRAAGGLFLASREVEDGSGARVWLVSDGFSSPGATSPGALTDAWWACSIVERLYGFVRPEVLDELRAAAYVAPKSRLESSPTQVPARGISVDAAARLVALTPSKGSTSPTAAIDALHALHPDPLPLPERIAALAETLAGAPSPLAVFREAWQTLDPRISIRDLRDPGMDALEVGAALFEPGGTRLVRRASADALRPRPADRSVRLGA